MSDNGLILDEYIPRVIAIDKSGRISSGNHVHLRLKTNPAEQHSQVLKPQKVLRLDAELPDIGTKFDILASAEAVWVYQVSAREGQKPRTYEGGSPLYIPVHDHCLKLADYFVYARVRDAMRQPPIPNASGGIACIEDLWETLYRRVPADGLFTIQQNPEPNKYYTNGILQGFREWRPGEQPEYGDLLEADPITIPGFVAQLMENLKPLSDEEAAKYSSNNPAKSFSETDLRALHNVKDLNLCCEFTHTDRAWRSLLLDKTVFPWLWDLTLSSLPMRPKDSPEDKLWNWELLVRKLSQIVIHEPEDATLNLPFELKNRRRIWRILDEARSGDIEERHIREWKLEKIDGNES